MQGVVDCGHFKTNLEEYSKEKALANTFLLSAPTFKEHNRTTTAKTILSIRILIFFARICYALDCELPNSKIKIAEENGNLWVSIYVEQKDACGVADIIKLNAEIEKIVAREDVLRREIAGITAEIEEANV